MFRLQRRQLDRWREQAEAAIQKAQDAVRDLAQFDHRASHGDLVSELYSGKMAVTERTAERDLPYGGPRDLLQKQDEDLDDLNPYYYVVVGFLCDPFSPMTNMKFDFTFVKDRARPYACARPPGIFIFVKFFNCEKHGGHLLLENPLSSQAWRLLRWPMEHQCGADYDLVNFLGDTLLKPTRFYTTTLQVALRYTDDGARPAEGQALTGRLVNRSNWMSQLAGPILVGLLQQLFEQEPGSDIDVYVNVSVFPVELVRRTAQANAGVIFNDLPPVADDITQWSHMSAILKSALQRICEDHAPCRSPWYDTWPLHPHGALVLDPGYRCSRTA
eukprot:12152148-Heterocapsa_arctica.AAC.1